jgi:hypothetical protein
MLLRSLQVWTEGKVAQHPLRDTTTLPLWCDFFSMSDRIVQRKKGVERRKR